MVTPAERTWLPMGANDLTVGALAHSAKFVPFSHNHHMHDFAPKAPALSTIAFDDNLNNFIGQRSRWFPRWVLRYVDFTVR